MLIHNKIDSSTVNGPGNRAVLWFQGCTLACPGCWNPNTHPFSSDNETALREITDWIKTLKDVEGITFSGGEPMQQAQYLYLILYFIRKERPDLSIGMFTGYSTKELEIGKYRWKSSDTGDWVKGSPELWHEIKSMLDWAVLGRYNQQMHSVNDPLRGSINQEVAFYTNKYSDKDLLPQMVEVTIDEDALVSITGFPNADFRREYPIEGERLDGEKLVSTSAKNNDSKKDSGEDGMVCA